MVERKMVEALERTRARSDADQVAAKRRAILNPEVDAFIKDGTANATTHSQDATLRSASASRPDAQLNTKIPEDLFHRARRAVFESQMSKTEPRTIQDLVSQALHAELKRLGF